jgi:hypothetical protein
VTSERRSSPQPPVEFVNIVTVAEDRVDRKIGALRAALMAGVEPARALRRGLWESETEAGNRLPAGPPTTCLCGRSSGAVGRRRRECRYFRPWTAQGAQALAKAKPTSRDLALEALSRLVADPAPRVMHGTAKAPGVFTGTGAPARAAAALCVAEGWLAGTGQMTGKGKTAKETFRITPAGLRQVIESLPQPLLLRDMLSAVDRQGELLRGLRSAIDAAARQVDQQTSVLREMLQKTEPHDFEGIVRRALSAASSEARAASQPAKSPGPAAASSDGPWLSDALHYLRDYQTRNPYGRCPLPELYHQVAEPRGLSIGLFHDGIRRLVEERRVRWHPFTGPAFQLEDDQYAIVAGQEIKYYVEPAG